MEKLSDLLEKTVNSIQDEIIELKITILTDKTLGSSQTFLTSQWKKYADFLYDIEVIFENTIIKENDFLKSKDLNRFYKKFLELIDLSVESAIHSSFETTIQPIIKLEESRRIKSEEIRKTFEGKEDKKSLTELQKLYQDNFDDFKSRYSKVHSESVSTIKESASQIYNSFLYRFWQIFEKCESPLEQAFFIGVFSDDSLQFLWFDKNDFENQVQVGKYRLDFVFQRNDIKVDVELDGHTYHEKTEEQAVNDRSRDRELQKSDWYVLRFHRKEIQLDLQACLNQVINFIKMKEIHLNRGS